MQILNRGRMIVQGRMLLVCESLAASLHMASICPYIIGNFLFLVTKDTLQSPAELQHFVPLSSLLRYVRRWYSCAS